MVLDSQKDVELNYAVKLLARVSSVLKQVEFHRFNPSVNEAACVLEECASYLKCDVDRLNLEVGK
jgi:hypothetical protein